MRIIVKVSIRLRFVIILDENEQVYAFFKYYALGMWRQIITDVTARQWRNLP